MLASRLVTFHAGEQLFIGLSLPHDLLWDFMVSYVCQDGEDDSLVCRARLTLPAQLVVFQLWLFKKLPLRIFSSL